MNGRTARGRWVPVFGEAEHSGAVPAHSHVITPRLIVPDAAAGCASFVLSLPRKHRPAEFKLESELPGE